MASEESSLSIFPRPGWVEHRRAGDMVRHAGRGSWRPCSWLGAAAEDIAAIGMTNQRETTIVWDKATGEPVCNAIVWQCRRTAPYCDELKAPGTGGRLSGKDGTGNRRILFRHKAAAGFWSMCRGKGAGREGELLFGTVETWLIWKLTAAAGCM